MALGARLLGCVLNPSARFPARQMRPKARINSTGLAGLLPRPVPPEAPPVYASRLPPPPLHREGRGPAPGGDWRAASSNGQRARPLRAGQGPRHAEESLLPFSPGLGVAAGAILSSRLSRVPPCWWGEITVTASVQIPASLHAARPPAPKPQPPAANRD